MKKTPEEIEALKLKYAAENAAKAKKREEKKSQYFENYEDNLHEKKYGVLKPEFDNVKYSDIWDPELQTWWSQTISWDNEAGRYRYTGRWKLINQ